MKNLLFLLLVLTFSIIIQAHDFGIGDVPNAQSVGNTEKFCYFPKLPYLDVYIDIRILN